MVELFCTPFVEMIERMRLEMENQQAIFDLPARKWYIPQQESSDLAASERRGDVTRYQSVSYVGIVEPWRA